MLLSIGMIVKNEEKYGYFFKNGKAVTEKAYEKSKRNLELLFEEIKKPKFDFSAFREIADCYYSIKDYGNVIKFINIALDNLDHSCIEITQYYSYKALYMLEMKRYNDLIDICNDYFSNNNTFFKKPIASDVDMYALRGEGYFHVKNYEKAAGNFIIFFKIYKDFKNGKLNTEDMFCNPVKMNDSILKNIYEKFFCSCINLKKYNMAMEYLKEFPIDRFQSDKKYMFSHFRDRAEIMLHTGWKSAKKFISLLDDENKKQFFRILRGKMFYTDKPEELFRVLSEFKEAVPEAEDSIELYRAYFNDDLQYEQIKSFTENYGADGNADILCIMLNCGMDISCFLTANDFNAENCVHEFYSDFPDKTFLIEEYDVDMLSSNAIVKAASLYGWAMAEALNVGKSIAQLFEMFGNIAGKWHCDFPNEKNIPGDIRAGVIVHGITEARKRKDYHTCINQMRILINACPDFAPFVSEYRKVIEQEIAPKKDVRSEIAKMAEAVKKNIRSMIEAGDISSAENTLLELEKLCPADAEIGILKYDIKMHKNR